MLYTDYLATEEERKIIKNKERQITIRDEEDKKKKYGNEIFHNLNNTTTYNSNLPVVKKENIFIKLFHKIIKFLKL